MHFTNIWKIRLKRKVGYQFPLPRRGILTSAYVPILLLVLTISRQQNVELNDMQKEVLHAVERGQNIFFTGSAGQLLIQYVIIVSCY
jgi:hypothetical protein